MSVAETTETELRIFLLHCALLGFGLGTIVQVLPSECSISVSFRPFEELK